MVVQKIMKKTKFKIRVVRIKINNKYQVNIFKVNLVLEIMLQMMNKKMKNSAKVIKITIKINKMYQVKKFKKNLILNMMIMNRKMKIY